MRPGGQSIKTLGVNFTENAISYIFIENGRKRNHVVQSKYYFSV